jgi:hypothetical protein
MPPAGFKPTIPASARPQTHALDRAATGIGSLYITVPDYSAVVRIYTAIRRRVHNSPPLDATLSRHMQHARLYPILLRPMETQKRWFPINLSKPSGDFRYHQV